MSREIEVPAYLINETTKQGEDNNGLIAHLDNGKSIDIAIKKGGMIITETKDEALREYLERPIWGGLRCKAVLSNGELVVKQFEKKDLDSLVQLMTEFEDDARQKMFIEKITERSILMLLNAVKDYKAEYFVVQYKEAILGQIICQPVDNEMSLKFVFKNSNKEEIEAAAKATKLVMRRLFGIYDLFKYFIDVKETQKPLLKELNIDMDKYPYQLTVMQIRKQREFFLQ